MKWFTEASDQAKELGIGFLCVGVINNSPGSVASVIQWSDELKDKVRYWIILNEKDEQDSTFEYWGNSDEVDKFVDTYDPAITVMPSRSPILQGLLEDNGVTLRSVAEELTEVEELKRARWVGTARAYLNQLFKKFDEVVPGFLPRV